ncbi:YcdB/YcdC domain-containing protein [Saccharibacillus sacchari]|uniref:YcdB/YcdC domain-containing protein n=1 Tax=Saccharibacillus sacchari TaxID=456493 RepID=UPI0004B00112|nr:YcdB/YcdC domain-containing protein [Saccharibacillus sacchari]
MKTIKREFPASRKTAAAVLAAAMLCSPVLATPAAAAETGESMNFTTSALTRAVPDGAKVSSAEAAAAVQKLFPTLASAQVTTADYSAYYEADSSPIKAWRLTYVLSDRENASASVSVDAVSGIVTDAYLPTPAPGQSDRELTAEQASEQAIAFLLRAMPERKASDFVKEGLSYAYHEGASVTPLFGSPSYSFSFRIKVNGVPSQSETVFLSLGQSGDVTGYTRSINRLPYPSAMPKLSATQAKQIFESEFALQLAYLPINGWGAPSSGYYLGYVPYDASLAPIDANSGKLLDPLTGLPYTESIAREGVALKTGSSPAPAALRTEEAAQLQLKKLDLIPSGYKLTGQQTYTQDYPEKNTKVWVLDLNRTVKGNLGNINVQLNAQTGQVYNYYLYEQDAPTGEPVKPTEADQSRAVAWASKLLPNAGEWRLISAPKEGDWNLTYTFLRYESDIPVMGDTASVTVDGEGMLTEFNTSEPSVSMTGQFPSANTINLTAAEAKAKFLEAVTPELYYSRFDRQSTDKSEKGESEIGLTYQPMLKTGGQLNGFNVLDASNGTWKNLYGANSLQRPSAATADISGHEHQAALEEMLDHAVLVADESGKVNPDAQLTRGEWADMLARAMQPDYSTYNAYAGMSLFRDVSADSPYQAAIGFLVSQNWLRPDKSADFLPDTLLTRDEMAHVLMGVLNYDKLAFYYNSTVDLPGIADAAGISHKGDAALAIKLGLLPAVDGNFLPQQTVTKADAAVVLTKLTDLQGKTDTFMNWNSW